jgi:DNA-binding transcriptional LysR family regulator
MHIENLRIFLDLVESESFSRAAKMNHVTQSAVSQKIRLMERHFGIRLVDRERKHFCLTPEGRRLYNWARQMLKDYQALLIDVQELKMQISGDLIIAASYDVGYYTLPHYLRDFLRAFPSVQLHLDFFRHSLVYHAIHSNIADIGFVSLPQAHDDLESRNFSEEELVIIHSPQDTRWKDEVLSLKALNHVSWISFSKEHPLKAWLDLFLSQHSLQYSIEKELGHIELVKLAVETSQGIAIVPKSSVQWECEHHLLKSMSIDHLPLRMPIAVIRKTSRFITPCIRSLLALLTGDIRLLPKITQTEFGKTSEINPPEYTS